MKAPLYVLTMFIGVVLTVHLAMNGKVGVALNNARVGNACSGASAPIGAIAHRAHRLAGGALAGLKNVHPVLLTAGLMGATLVFGIAWVIPQIGAGPMTFSLLAGQIVGGMVVSHFGWLGSPVQPVSMTNLLGALVMLGGVYLATRT